MEVYYDNRNYHARGITNSVIDGFCAAKHPYAMLAKIELLVAARRKAKTQGAMAKVLGLTPPRMTELFKGERDLSYDEARKLIMTYGLAEGPVRRPLNASTVASILQALAPSIPAGELSEKGAESLAEGLIHALELLSESGATDPTDRELALAARAAALRFREGGLS